MASLMVIALVALWASGVMGAEDVPIAVQHSGDVIKYLWWALGVLASFAVFVSSGVAVWAITRILEHDRDIAVIKTRCADREDQNGC